MWKWLKFVILLTVICVVCGEDFGEQDSSQGSRGISEADREEWRALKAFQDGDDAWVPRDRLEDPPEVHVQKRRRLRKRKRRPTPTITQEFDSEESSSDHVVPPGRRVLPQRFEHNMETWKEMSEEIVKRPNVRRRITPEFLPSEEVNEDNMGPLEPVIIFEGEVPDNKEEQAVKFAEDVVDEISKNVDRDPATKRATIPDLRAVLKQSGTGSLSEILQQKNLSLSELLMGNLKAISALTETPQEVTEAVTAKTPAVSDTTKYKRLPPSIGLRKTINRNFEQEEDSSEALSNKEILEAQRKRLSLLGHKDNRLFSTVTKYDVVTEPTTERRIFVPSHPKYYSQTHVFRPSIYEELNKPQETEESSTTTTTTTTTTTPKPVSTTSTTTLKSKPKNLPITNAKISKLTKKLAVKIEAEEEEETEEEENYPMFNFPKPIPINLQEVSGLDHERNKFDVHDVSEADNDAPVRMSIDLDVFPETIAQKVDPETDPKPTPPITEATSTEEPLGEKVVQATAKDEIMEIMRDPISRERLSRILENRNMTVKELVEQRERGSSQLHLADIFHNKTREPEPKGEPFIGSINVEHFDSFPLFERQQKSRRTFEDDQSPIFKPSSTASVVEVTAKSSEPTLASTSFPAVKIGVDNTRNIPFLWKQLESDVFSRISQSNNQEANDILKDPLNESQENEPERFSDEGLQRLEDIDAKFSLVSNEKLDVESDNFPEEEEVLINIPTGVKSAIFVSLAIICLSIVVFLTILLVFKWTQRQNKKINYCNSLSTKIKSPMIVQRRPTSAIKSFMNETLGRKKNYYKSNVQSTDDLWECGRERIPSF